MDFGRLWLTIRLLLILVGALLALLIAAPILLYATAAHAKTVAIGKSRGDVVTLTDDSCKSVVLEKVKPEFRSNFQAATYYVGKTQETVNGCYWLYGDVYVTIWEDGDVFEIPLAFFKLTRA